TNYPLVRLKQGRKVYYCPTSGFLPMSVSAPSDITVQSTQFTVPSTVPAGTYTLCVVANGIEGCSPRTVTVVAPPAVPLNRAQVNAAIASYVKVQLGPGNAKQARAAEVAMKRVLNQVDRLSKVLQRENGRLARKQFKALKPKDRLPPDYAPKTKRPPPDKT